jgi:TP901 family phage tail tape measure protein
MAGDTNSNIFINIDTSQAMTQLRLLEKELTTLNRSLIVGTKTAAAAQSKYAQSLLHNVNATGQWTASMTRMSTASEQFAKNLDKQKLSLKEYFRYGAASTKTFGKMFGSEFDTIGKLVDKRVKTLQQQYVQLGRDAQGAMNAMKFNPKSLNYGNVTTQLMAATQRQQIFNKLVDDGSTKLLNFGKNTQWAGRQLMVGFTIPLMLFGSQAIKTFKEIETQVIRFKKVYGDIFTDQGATAAALKNIRDLGDEYTKYGLKVSDTIKMAADAAAAGFSGKGLESLVEQTNKLAVLGGVTQEKALETTIALKNAFQIDTGKMAGTIDFLNAVENQTVVALDDLTEAIPKVAPVIQQLGGDVKDLAYFMAAMQEGGISAAQGANALKSGLASLINPSNAASKAAAAVGINIKGIVEANAGNLRNTVTGFAQALQPLTDLERSRVIEKVFGKYQFARISALLNNLGREGTQAARVLQLTNASVEELAILSQRELKIQADSPMNKFVGSVERLKAAIAPIGELFAKVLTPAIEFISRIADESGEDPSVLIPT